MPPTAARQVVVLAPMPLELDAITTAFGLVPEGDAPGSTWTGAVGGSQVRAVHVGMGPPRTRAALTRLFAEAGGGGAPVDHVIIAGICGGLDPDRPVGTLVNPEFVVDHRSGAVHRHTPPGDASQEGKLVTTETATLDRQLSARFFAAGCLGVDMETSAVAEVCAARGCDWSVYRCIGDRIFDGLLDDRVLQVANPDGSGDPDALRRLLEDDPGVRDRLGQLARDATLAARLAAEAAARGCRALDG